MQANIFEAYFNTSERYPGVMNGAFFWDNWMTTDALWAEFWAGARNTSLRGKLAEDVVRDAYAGMAARER